MASQRQRKLDAVVSRLQLVYGPAALRRADPGEKRAPVPRIATSFAELDAALDGGLPQGYLTEISGPATSGKLTLTAKAIATAHGLDADVLAAWIDPTHTCDPDYLDRCGIDLHRLLVVHPGSLEDALSVMVHLVESNTLALLAVDDLAPAQSDEAVLAAALARLPALLAHTATALVVLTEPHTQSRALAHAAAVRIILQHEQWITRAGDVRGYRSQAEVVKNRLGPVGVRVPVQIVFNGTVRGEGL